MNPAEQLMLAQAYIHGLQAKVAQLKAQILGIRDAYGSKSFETQLGPVSVAVPKPKPVVTDEVGLFEWVQNNYPAEIVPAIRPTFRSALVSGLRCAGPDVLTEQGEVVGWAVVETGEPYVTARLTTEVKEAAAVQIEARFDEMMKALE